MIKSVIYSDPKNQQIYGNPDCPVKHLQFTVVNNPQPDQFFENYRLRDMSTNDEVPVFWIIKDAARGTGVQNRVQIIFTPHYIVTHITMMEDIVHPIKNVIRPTYPIRARQIPAEENAFFNQMQQAGINVVYTNQYGVSLDDGVIDGEYYAEDHETLVLKLTERERNGSVSLWKNITWHVESTVQASSKKDKEFLSFAPYVANTRHNPAKSELHKFDEFFIKPGETVTSTVFEDSTHSLLYVGKGSVNINGVEVNKFEFYEHDATIPASITSTDNSVVVQVSKVPTIDFSGLITE